VIIKEHTMKIWPSNTGKRSMPAKVSRCNLTAKWQHDHMLTPLVATFPTQTTLTVEHGDTSNGMALTLRIIYVFYWKLAGR
jgi:hypothetical protein